MKYCYGQATVARSVSFFVPGYTSSLMKMSSDPELECQRPRFITCHAFDLNFPVLRNGVALDVGSTN
jgi:hypothetical protein